MSGAIRPAIPAGHPVRATFHALAERGLGQRDICDEASALYVSNMMAELLRTDDLFRIRDDRGRRLEHLADLVAVAESTADAAERKRRHRYLGDFTLFMLGLFPESLDRPRRAIGCDYFQQRGRRSYNIVADLALTDAEPDLLRRLSGRF